MQTVRQLKGHGEDGQEQDEAREKRGDRGVVIYAEQRMCTRPDHADRGVGAGATQGAKKAEEDGYEALASCGFEWASHTLRARYGGGRLV